MTLVKRAAGAGGGSLPGPRLGREEYPRLEGHLGGGKAVLVQRAQDKLSLAATSQRPWGCRLPSLAGPSGTVWLVPHPQMGRLRPERNRISSEPQVP